MRLGNSSTISSTVASSRVIIACFVDSRGCWSRNSSVEIPELATPRYSILRSGRTNALVNHGGFPLLGGINWSCSSQCTPAVHHIVRWWPSTLIWIRSHPMACCLIVLCPPGLRTNVNCATWVIVSVVAVAASRWTELCLHCCSVSAGGAVDQAPVVRLDSDRLTAGCGVCGATPCCCGKGEEDDNEKKWEVSRNIELASSQNGMSGS